jgi:hypothetical protein
LHIIDLSQNKLGMGDLEIEVEYQSGTIGKYSLGYNGKDFQLIPKQTACLAKENCGIPNSSVLKATQATSCTPDSGCCS